MNRANNAGSGRDQSETHTNKAEQRNFVTGEEAFEKAAKIPVQDVPLVKMRSNGSVLHLTRMESSASLMSQIEGRQRESSSNCAIFKASSAEN